MNVPLINFTQSDINRFWDKVNIAGEDSCWNWKKPLKKSRYGIFNLNGRTLSSNRIAYYLSTSVDPCELCVCHTCDNTACCNPKHLFAAIHVENMRDRERKQRSFVCGNGSYKILKWSDAIRIRELYNSKRYSQSELGRIYGVGQGVIGSIVRNKSWVIEKTIPKSQYKRLYEALLEIDCVALESQMDNLIKIVKEDF